MTFYTSRFLLFGFFVIQLRKKITFYTKLLVVNFSIHAKMNELNNNQHLVISIVKIVGYNILKCDNYQKSKEIENQDQNVG